MIKISVAVRNSVNIASETFFTNIENNLLFKKLERGKYANNRKHKGKRKIIYRKARKWLNCNDNT